MVPMTIAVTVIGVITLSQVVFITVAWRRLRDIEKKIDDAVAQLLAEMRQLTAELRMEIRQSGARLRLEMRQLTAELRGTPGIVD